MLIVVIIVIALLIHSCNSIGYSNDIISSLSSLSSSLHSNSIDSIIYNDLYSSDNDDDNDDNNNTPTTTTTTTATTTTTTNDISVRYKPKFNFLTYEDKYQSKLPLSLSSLQYHGTTTLAFIYKDSVIVAIDSRASVGNYVGSRTVKKIFPVSDTIVATMAGGAADCSFWIRRIAKQVKLFEYDNNTKMTVCAVAKLLSSTLREYRGAGLSVGTMVSGWDKVNGPSLYYVDSEGSCIKGKMFSVGSGSQLAYSILDDEFNKRVVNKDINEMTLDEAIDTAAWSIRYAAHRDGFSGGYINIFHMNCTGPHHVLRKDSRLMKVN